MLPNLNTLTFLLLPSLALSSPLLTRQTSPCAPTSYTITNYLYTTSPSSGATVHFTFQSHFPDPSLIQDAVSSPTSCDAKSPDGTIPNSNACTADRRLLFDLRGPQERGEWQVSHSWRCDGQEWMASTPVKFEPLNCAATEEGGSICSSPDVVVTPLNVRRICGGPTCQ
ncbi:hypothetical protein BU24DRAFT_489288 [Aaosphaeria arxii CBS 175.79]|uniref:AA1-like domain-containing protein n=1 Tax=Aaosphaeria arxii CBS 175.79 TaxID=1450172 RepID=A0A6A5Y223_9PLEO|nr:uncharacterized protein BU24DRAFT_489288 [Aaosphaeria arxii CBS 175.79]KAF2019296.1 hypothetical protein BU24DRAFT_489288 [Aaosphaeria arxii CBS 175.79]